MRSILPEGVALIKEFEGLRLEAYRDAVGVLTIGYGHTGSDVTPGLTISPKKADDLLQRDLLRFSADVSRLTPRVTDTQFSALVAFAFNVGSDIDDDTRAEGLGDSTLLRLHNAGNYRAAAAQFEKWIYAGGRKLPGLKRRRAAEAALYLKPGRPI